MNEAASNASTARMMADINLNVMRVIDQGNARGITIDQSLEFVDNQQVPTGHVTVHITYYDKALDKRE
jgi:hypothetical protein